MGVLDKAASKEVREAYVASRARNAKYKPEEVEAMRSYVLSDDCVSDLSRLKAGDYFLDYPIYRLVPKNFRDTKRAVYKLEGTQAILIKLIAFAMRDMESDIFSDRLFSFRSDKTAQDLLNEICSNEDLPEFYIIKTDVSNYVGSIVPEFIVPMLEEIFMPDDPEFFGFLKWLLLRGKVIDIHGNVIDHCPGGLGGLALGCFFMNVYLREMDDYFGSRAAFYSRYSDDILICARSMDEIKEYEKVFFEMLERLRLTTNEEKTKVLMPGEAFDLLGMELCGSRVTISDHSMKKIKRKLRKNTERALIKRNTGKMTPEESARNLILGFNRFFYGYEGSGKLLSWARWSFPVINDTSCLEEIDHYIQNSLRYVLYGSMKKRNRSIPYSKLQELGYRSLVYYYHHPDKIEGIERW